jgi:hypothetical protein
MAIVNRAPFWVPRPPNDFPWVGKPIPRDASLYPPAAANPFVSRTWNHYVESAVWLGVPSAADPIFILAAKPSVAFRPPQFYEAPAWSYSVLPNVNIVGVEPFTSRQRQSYYEALPWLGTPSAADPIFMLSTQPPTVARWNYSDEVASWRQPYQFNPSLFPPPPANAPTTSRQRFWYDDAAFWVGAPSAADPIFMLAKEAFQPARWNYNWDEAAPWRQPYQYNPLVFPPLPPSSPTVARQRLWHDDAPSWMAKPLISYTLSALSFKPVIPAKATYLDDPPPWLQPTQRNVNLSPPPPPGNPFTARQRHWNDEAPSWRGAPAASQTLYSLSFKPFVPARATYVDDPPAWRRTQQNNVGLLPPPAPPQVLQFRWNFTLDDPAFWIQVPRPYPIPLRPRPSPTPIGCVIYGRASLPVVYGRASSAIIYGKACECSGNTMTTIHPQENVKTGDTWQFKGILSYADGTPFNLGTGCNILWGIEPAAGGSLVIELSLGSGITVLDAANGICLITVPPVQSAAVPVGSYVDQLQATDPTGYVSTQWTGPINVYASFFS